MIPTKLEESAKAAGLCTYTYQTLLRPSTTTTTTSLNDSIWNWDPAKSRDKRIVIVGGGATACELAQSLVRLIGCQVDLVAPTLLRGDDVALANAAAQLLTREGVNLYLRCRVEDIGKDRRVQLSGPPTTLPPCDAMIFCTGRSPGPSLERLQVSKAQVQWNPTQGVLVRGKKNLQSISASRVYACGDCCSAVAPLARCATHAAWTGYYAALQSRLPRVLTWGAKLVHTTVPRVIYTDPELVSVGLSLEECVAKYGMNGFVRCHVSTKETDRSDMDGVVENENDEDTGTHVGFIELRATQVTGKILGMTACGPTAAELANEMSVILENGMRAMDVAKSLHSYPSHGYLLHRVALALALGNTWGLLEASGTIGKYLAWLGRKVSQLILWIQTRMRRSSALKAWEAEGVSKSFLSLSPSSWGTKTVGLSSFWDRFQSKKSSESIKGERTTTDDESPPNSDDNEWNEWFFRRPMGL
jgi:pyruvate/2-oxoglutarate dehydrogenase complex dihydrolipoamide dehydrogenase (E3) component